MTLRLFSVVAALAAASALASAHAAPDAALLSPRPGISAVTFSPNISAYRQYAKNQADNLALMTRALATGIKHGDLDAAQSTYGPAHRFFKRIEPLARLLRGPAEAMDAPAARFAAKEADPTFSGFHKIEYELFANGSTANLADASERLQRDAHALFERIATMEISPRALLDETVGLVRDVADKGLTGDEERYSKTDLWNIEANIEGVREVLALVRPRVQAQNTRTLSRAAIHFVSIGRLLEKNKQGCGFKNFDEVGKDDKDALKREIAALADELAALRDTVAMN